ncbi:hypothetical protein O5O45_17200 [Hahella aquimaris]|uniref:hypothetical protein n=1 Tax=Hahella sp. HNIBRBA332 TaxID=3015983 RepID=UPI00273C332C|nr:hypothetical protein [Hahella sp. HNIBRBA332]WLQ11476.1 hypothetical protein O5O45_17200 [Hahella sp. HNIBRBA332]
MNISAELSFYPFTDDFKPPVRDVIKHLEQQPGVDVRPNRMSTQVFGSFEDVTAAINATMRWSFERYDSCVFVTKIMNSDRSPKD